MVAGKSRSRDCSGRRGRPNDNAFTLNEMLIVMVVLSIVAGIAIMGMTGLQGHAESPCSDADVRIDSSIAAANAVNPGGAARAFTTGGNC